MLTKNNRKLLVLIGIGTIAFLSMIIYLIQISISENSTDFNANWGEFLFSLSISAPIAFIVFYADFIIVRYINNSNWFRKRTIVRIISETFILTVIAFISTILGNLPFIDLSKFNEYLYQIPKDPSAIAAILFNIFVITVIEFFVHYQQKNKLQEEYNHILYQQLKSQINPHFLFNSLSVIIALMHKDINQATDYTHKLSNVYRYVLTHNEDDTISLSKELRFINDYIEILQIRYGSGLQVCINIAEEDCKKRIPPMSLQVLIENIVKHNIISTQSPLNIHIYSESSFIVVSNTIIPRKHTEPGMGIGLDNLRKKYKLIAEKEIIIESTDSNFSVKLPMI